VTQKLGSLYFYPYGDQFHVLGTFRNASAK